ncbi:hypothetical protein [Mycobacteroides abscessus]|uniref:hypothetical protein n=1 Tax=Desemzia sp. FAM 23989 TaxID=3259523 RepID=UPI0009C8BD39|nr:Uncharacterised protein [Mycobacteroides abscessus subsp. abscessus]
MPIKQADRFEILNLLYRQLMVWDGTSVNANEIIEKNKSLLIELKTIDVLLSEQGNGKYNEMEQQHVASIIKAQQELLTVIKHDRTDILEKMKQVNQKNKIVNNYYSSFQQSIFVDKGM